LRKKLRNLFAKLFEIMCNNRHHHVTQCVRVFCNYMILSHVTSVGSLSRSRCRVYIHIYFLSRKPFRQPSDNMHQVYYSTKIGIFRLLFWAILNRWLALLHLHMNTSKKAIWGLWTSRFVV